MSHAIRPQVVPRPIPALLAFIAGFVDICAYFALFGIFVAQLTGSFVLAGARLASGQQEVMTLTAIPTFFLAGCAATTLAVARAPGGHAPAWVLGLECALLTAMFTLMQIAAPLDTMNSAAVIASALLGIAAMGVQSASVRLFMKGAPSTNVMTTNTTQLAIDATIVLLSLGCWTDPDQAAESRERFGEYWPVMAGFFLGTATGALCFRLAGITALAAPIAAAYALLGWTAWRGLPRR